MVQTTIIQISLGLLALLFLQGASAKSICCKNVGCFTNEAPFGHLYLPECPEELDIKFNLYTRGGELGLLSRDHVPNHFNPSKRSIFIVHGWRNSGTTGWVIEMKDALLKKDDVNVVVVDWETGAGHLYYPFSATNVRSVGAEVADMMDTLVEEGSTKYSEIWCVGFSLGAHVCGHAGLRTESKIGRITGLDPAGPYFDSYDIMTGLNPGSALYVEAIHTDGYGLAAFYGTLRPLGHADFYPNEGWYQPGCWTYGDKEAVRKFKENATTTKREMDIAVPYGISCSHSRAPDLFIESVRNNRCFTSRQICEDHNTLPGSCSSTTDKVMGYGGEDDTRSGKYFLLTTANQPYCK